MEKSTNMIETVGLLVGVAQSDTIYRDVYLQRAGQHAGGDGVGGQDRRENTRGVNR